MEHLNRATGETEENINQALKLYDDVMEANRGDKHFEQIAVMVADRGNKAWDQYFSFDPDSWAFLKRNFDYDPIPALQGTSCPVLAIFGARDLMVPVQRSATIFKQMLTEAKNPDFSVEIFFEADHRIQNGDPPILVPGYLKAMGQWLQQRVTTGKQNG